MFLIFLPENKDASSLPMATSSLCEGSFFLWQAEMDAIFQRDLGKSLKEKCFFFFIAYIERDRSYWQKSVFYTQSIVLDLHDIPFFLTL